ncbi:lasso peptide biosynthesis protein [Nonomuraea sp. NPDC000554]|uniref:lasso peptide biosynthesis protein n=1 Tax=Nonomuraea sp. NPDC000554 TaxID=3154259 RepID=UPI0033289945
MIRALRASRAAIRFLEKSRSANGSYLLMEWPEVKRSRFLGGGDVGNAVAALRLAQRCSVGFLDPIEDALYLTAGLRLIGFEATFHVGRESFAANPPPGLHAWVECDGRVVSTSLPVREEYVEVAALP